jgi:hypothetical protein
MVFQYMYRPKMATIECLQFSSYKETGVFSFITIIIIIIIIAVD